MYGNDGGPLLSSRTGEILNKIRTTPDAYLIFTTETSRFTISPEELDSNPRIRHKTKTELDDARRDASVQTAVKFTITHGDGKKQTCYRLKTGVVCKPI